MIQSVYLMQISFALNHVTSSADNSAAARLGVFYSISNEH
jgi:hypothetical protein